MRHIAFALLVLAGEARAYSEDLHQLITSRSLPRDRAVLGAPAGEELARFRALFYRAAVEQPDEALRAKFRQRYPTEAALDGWAFKELFMLDPAALVRGFDPIPDGPRTRDAVVALASRWPDDDRRNRNRFLRDASRAIQRAPDGSPLPYDPGTLDMGGLTGTTSQAHAHYGLPQGPFSDDPEVLKRDPRHFAIPPGIRVHGQDFAQIYADLALLAAGVDEPWLAAAFTGASFHHIQDVANQIHTVQVGTYEFFRSAWMQSKLRDAATLGGLLGPRVTLRDAGLRLLANHHLFSEDLFAKRLAEAARGAPAPPEIAAALAGLGRDDQTFEVAADRAAAASGGQFARALADALVEVSSFEGPDVYRLAFQISSPELRRWDGHEYRSPDDDPDQWLYPPGPARDEELARFYLLAGRGIARAGTALRIWRRYHELAAPNAALSRNDIVRRTLALLLPYHEQAAARRARYAPAAIGRASIAWGYPAAAGVLLAGIVAAVVLARRR